jgi:hypothetical protein
LTAGRMTDGGVMHQLGRSQLAGRLPSLVHNSESGIRAGVREKAQQCNRTQANPMARKISLHSFAFCFAFGGGGVYSGLAGL